MLPVVAIVGRPNVGKSTLFNRIVGERISITDDQPGVTRDRIYAKASWLGVEFNLIDTGGIEIANEPFLSEIKHQAEIAMEEADVIIYVTDCRSGITKTDEDVAKILYKTKKPVICAVNKVDDQKFKDELYSFYALGFPEVIGISGSHGVGLGDLLDKTILLLPKDKQDNYDENTIKFCLIGRPNVGKSSLTNALLNEERVIVSNIAGTTRDSIDTGFKYHDKEYVVIDTAGIRKRGKVYENTEKYSVMRAMAAIDRSDVCLIVINADEGIREQDKHIAGYAEEAGKSLVVVVNKWDLIKKDDKTQKYWEMQVKENFKFIDYAKIVFLSAITKKRIHTLIPEIESAFESYSRRVNTSVLNDIMLDLQAMNQAPLINGGRVKIMYATQVATKPPTFVLFVNKREYMHFSYRRYILNNLRAAFDFEGTPIRLVLRERE